MRVINQAKDHLQKGELLDWCRFGTRHVGAVDEDVMEVFVVGDESYSKELLAQNQLQGKQVKRHANVLTLKNAASTIGSCM